MARRASIYRSSFYRYFLLFSVSACVLMQPGCSVLPKPTVDNWKQNDSTIQIAENGDSSSVDQPQAGETSQASNSDSMQGEPNSLDWDSGIGSKLEVGFVAQASHNADSNRSGDSILADSMVEPATNYQLAAHEVESIENQPTASPSDQAASNTIHAHSEKIESAASTVSLVQLESIALSQNPAIKELAATTQKAAGYRYQVGLKANPTVGYQAQQLADRGTDQHLIFAEQEFVTGNKLGWNQRVQNEALRAQLFELEAQRMRVITDIRSNFFAALALQRQLELIDDFQKVSAKGVQLAEVRMKAAEGSQIDVLQARIQNSEVELSKQQVRVQYAGYLRELAALAGVNSLPGEKLLGDFPSMERLDWSALSDSMVQSSPEYTAAQTRIRQAQAAVQRQNVQATPNVGVQLGAGVDNGTNSGMINLQVGAPIPIHNKNEGNIAAAQAELCRAMMEAERIEKSIQARLASVAREYDSAAAAVHTYQNDILPSAQEALTLAEQAYTAGETSFLQVLVARRTFFDSNILFVKSQSELAIAQAKLDGYVLTGGLDPVVDGSGDSSLRDQVFGQQ